MMRISISEARARLPELAQLVMDTPGAEVIIEHRDRKERLILTTERHLRTPEAMVHSLRQQVSVAPFVLAGSVTSELSDEDLEAVIDQIRSDADAASRQKLDSLADR
jgi:hypothetical protein